MSVSIYDKTKLSTGIINSSGEVTDNQYYGITDYIKVRKGSNIKTSILANSWDDAYCAFYDNSQVFVSSKKEDAELNIISPCDGYVRFCVNASYINNAMITSTDVADTVNSLNENLNSKVERISIDNGSSITLTAPLYKIGVVYLLRGNYSFAIMFDSWGFHAEILPPSIGITYTHTSNKITINNNIGSTVLGLFLN